MCLHQNFSARKRPNRVSVSQALVGLLMMFSVNFAYSQTSTIEPTSATDADVKIHNTRKVFLFRHDKRMKKSGGQARGTEHPGQSLHKKTRVRSRSGKEAQVFQRHNHFARKDNNTRSRHRNTKRHS
jgi:hypothetical protein